MTDDMKKEAENADAERYRKLSAKLSNMDINRMTPVAAMVALQELIEEVNDN